MSITPGVYITDRQVLAGRRSNRGTVRDHGTEKLTAIRPDGSIKWQTPLTYAGTPMPVVFSSDESSAYVFYLVGGYIGPLRVIARIDTTTGIVTATSPTSSCVSPISPYAFSDSGVLLTAESHGNLFAFSPDLQTCSLIPTATVA
ncbi:MAG TPA: hypothetical protein VFZ73_17965, partial [Gemmatimonadaceae bacterium]